MAQGKKSLEQIINYRIEKLEKIAALTRDDVLDRLRDAENYGRTEDYTEVK